ncbi:hypothetical protein PS645_02283 [Pseudomonas fluorescens]|uniref:Secreted protein n=1 Tax=Pseudomonas fluorescens TaxID=294 RepID=A0A5E6SM45_PSEFL|nr:hypothetical protein [Pseudomonas fluorescens]VVM81292.1 hypothetical protein PS645_02283 [Pseudomonas fluorescens]
MKRTVFAGLLISAAMLSSPAFAADKDLCATNIQKITDFIATAPSVGENSADNLKAGLAKAKASQAAGNDKECVETTGGIVAKIEVRDPARNN